MWSSRKLLFFSVSIVFFCIRLVYAWWKQNIENENFFHSFGSKGIFISFHSYWGFSFILIFFILFGCFSIFPLFKAAAITHWKHLSSLFFAFINSFLFLYSFKRTYRSFTTYLLANVEQPINIITRKFVTLDCSRPAWYLSKKELKCSWMKSAWRLIKSSLILLLECIFCFSLLSFGDHEVNFYYQMNFPFARCSKIIYHIV